MAMKGIKTTYQFEREHPGDIRLLIPGWMGDAWGPHGFWGTGTASENTSPCTAILESPVDAERIILSPVYISHNVVVGKTSTL